MNVGAVLLLLVAVAFITMLVKYNNLTVGVFWTLVVLFFISIILSLDFYISHISAFELVLIIGTICVGIALLLNVPINDIIYKLSDLRDVASLSFGHAIILISVSIILTLIGGFIPAKIASKKDPVVALRSE